MEDAINLRHKIIARKNAYVDRVKFAHNFHEKIMFEGGMHWKNGAIEVDIDRTELVFAPIES